uniref:Ubiquitin conjugating enzyme n=1 Tax=Rhizophora mucronata TaxID=61149 RepID=A0A2P2LG53_RHIMU
MTTSKVPPLAGSLAHGILLGPAPGSCLILSSVCLIHVGNFWHQGIVWVWIRQQGTYGE